MDKKLRLEHKITFPWLIAFALPTILSSIFSSLYTTVAGTILGINAGAPGDIKSSSAMTETYQAGKNIK